MAEARTKSLPVQAAANPEPILFPCRSEKKYVTKKVLMRARELY